MERSEINDRVHRVLRFVDDPSSTDGETLVDELSLALDQLAVAVHFIRYVFDSTEYPDAPARDYQQVRRAVEQRFPQLGTYNIAATVTTSVGESTCNVGDAVDDLADIALELYEFMWRREHTSDNDAYWHLENGYRRHWGQHLRALQLYLDSLRDGL